MITLHLFNILKGSCFYHSSFYKSTFYLYPLSICPYLKSRLFRHYFWNFGLPRFALSSFSSAEWFGTEFPEFASIFVARNGTEFRAVFSSDEQFGTECSYFCCTERNFELFSLLLKGSEGNSDRLLLFLFNGTEFRVVFSSAEGFGTELREFLFRGTAGIPSEITICSVYSVFRGIIFLSEIPNPSCVIWFVEFCKEANMPRTVTHRWYVTSLSCWRVLAISLGPWRSIFISVSTCNSQIHRQLLWQ